MGSAGTAVEEDTDADLASGVADPWVTIVWNDPVNLMSYVTYVFESYFGYPRVQGRTADDAGAQERSRGGVQWWA